MGKKPGFWESVGNNNWGSQLVQGIVSGNLWDNHVGYNPTPKPKPNEDLNYQVLPADYNGKPYLVDDYGATVDNKGNYTPAKPTYTTAARPKPSFRPKPQPKKPHPKANPNPYGVPPAYVDYSNQLDALMNASFNPNQARYQKGANRQAELDLKLMNMPLLQAIKDSQLEMRGNVQHSGRIHGQYKQDINAARKTSEGDQANLLKSIQEASQNAAASRSGIAANMAGTYGTGAGGVNSTAALADVSTEGTAKSVGDSSGAKYSGDADRKFLNSAALVAGAGHGEYARREMQEASKVKGTLMNEIAMNKAAKPKLIKEYMSEYRQAFESGNQQKLAALQAKIGIQDSKYGRYQDQRDFVFNQEKTGLEFAAQKDAAKAETAEKAATQNAALMSKYETRYSGLYDKAFTPGTPAYNSETSLAIREFAKIKNPSAKQREKYAQTLAKSGLGDNKGWGDYVTLQRQGG